MCLTSLVLVTLIAHFTPVGKICPLSVVLFSNSPYLPDSTFIEPSGMIPDSTNLSILFLSNSACGLHLFHSLFELAAEDVRKNPCPSEAYILGKWQ